MKLSFLKQQIEELDAKATKGPWKPDDMGNSPYVWADSAVKEPHDALVAKTWNDDEELGAANRDFIALSRTAMPELLRRLLVAEEALQQIIWDTGNHPHIQERATAALATIRGEEE